MQYHTSEAVHTSEKMSIMTHGACMRYLRGGVLAIGLNQTLEHTCAEIRVHSIASVAGAVLHHYLLAGV